MSLAPLGRRRLAVRSNDALGAYRVLRVADPDGPPPQAGQFAMLAAAERWGGGEGERPYLPRAFSYARHVDGEAWFLLEDVGPGTERLAELHAGDEIDVLGPLGQGFRAPGEGRRALLVGGGVGIAPLAILQDELGDAGVSVGALLGFRDDAHAAGGALLGLRDGAHATGGALLGLRDGAHAAEGALRSDVRLATDDGSVGHHGLVTDLLEAELDADVGTDVYACGPPPMLEAVRALCERRGVDCQLALEAGMACGFGACFGCVVSRRGGGYLRVCVDGPVVAGDELERVV